MPLGLLLPFLLRILPYHYDHFHDGHGHAGHGHDGHTSGRFTAIAVPPWSWGTRFARHGPRSFGSERFCGAHRVCCLMDFGRPEFSSGARMGAMGVAGVRAEWQCVQLDSWASVEFGEEGGHGGGHLASAFGAATVAPETQVGYDSPRLHP
jgi:hypothetical protein